MWPLENHFICKLRLISCCCVRIFCFFIFDFNCLPIILFFFWFIYPANKTRLSGLSQVFHIHGFVRYCIIIKACIAFFSVMGNYAEKQLKTMSIATNDFLFFFFLRSNLPKWKSGIRLNDFIAKYISETIKQQKKSF